MAFTLVTGAGGFIGRRLVQQLVNQGTEVVGLVRTQPAGMRSGQQCRLITGDIRDIVSRAACVVGRRPRFSSGRCHVAANVGCFAGSDRRGDSKSGGSGLRIADTARDCLCLVTGGGRTKQSGRDRIDDLPAGVDLWANKTGSRSRARRICRADTDDHPETSRCVWPGRSQFVEPVQDRATWLEFLHATRTISTRFCTWMI